MIDHPGWRLRDQRTLVRHGWRLSAGGEHKHGISVGGRHFGKIFNCQNLPDIFSSIFFSFGQASFGQNK